MVKWARFMNGGYEVSTRGDKRFSALYAQMPDGRCLEAHYQCDVKGYCPGSSNWRLGKGKPPRNRRLVMRDEYLALWRQWAAANPALLDELRRAVGPDGTLTDRFASTPVSQAWALATLLNE